MKHILFFRATAVVLLCCIAMSTTSCKTSFALQAEKKYGLHIENGIYAEMNTSKGSIILQLFYEDVPLTVANFMTLALGNNPKVASAYKGKKYYDGLIFHRVIENFVIQAGCPLGDGTGGPGYQFRNEIPHDEKGNLNHKHARGVLAMANAGPDTNGSQFYITRSNTPHLDGGYTIFGRVLEGMEVVERIRQGDALQSVKIHKIGKTAKKFKEVKVFNKEISR